eukprot:605945-Prymnesium_polylepis.1
MRTVGCLGVVGRPPTPHPRPHPRTTRAPPTPHPRPTVQVMTPMGLNPPDTTTGTVASGAADPIRIGLTRAGRSSGKWSPLRLANPEVRQVEPPAPKTAAKTVHSDGGLFMSPFRPSHGAQIGLPPSGCLNPATPLPQNYQELGNAMLDGCLQDPSKAVH